MENHPIPQDITGFQFKLIGNMTVKQFVYLAAGTVLAWFIFFILPLHLIIRFPLAVMFLGFGASLAFIPVDGRPMDTMIANLIRALFAPTKYIYRKTGGNISEQLQTQPQAQPTASTSNVAAANAGMPVPAPAPQQPIAQTNPPGSVGQATLPATPIMQSAPMLNMPPAMPQTDGRVIEYPNPQTTPAPLMSLDDEEDKQKAEEGGKLLENEKKLEEEAAVLKKELEVAKSAEKSGALPLDPSAVHQKAEELEKLLTQTTRQKEALEKEFLILKAQLERQKQEKFSPGVATAPLKQTQRVRKVPDLPAAPQDPNLIVGAVKDPRGNPLPNILVEVKDTDDNPVRAFKTNGLGQFASATSLSNGKYIIIFEDPGGKNKFDAVQIEATGAPLMPLEIFSVDPREELRRELFN